jgi:hypothetical protein
MGAERAEIFAKLATKRKAAFGFFPLAASFVWLFIAAIVLIDSRPVSGHKKYILQVCRYHS